MRMLLLVIHGIAGSLGLMSGFVALSVMKGATAHRKIGMLFVYAMLTVAFLGSTMAVIWNKAPESNGPVGLFTAYLVMTALTTVREPSAGSRRLAIGLTLIALVAGGALAAFGVQAYASPGHKLHGAPFFPFFIFGVIAALAIAGDLRLIGWGEARTIRGPARLARHLWRMCTALLIASLSIGQLKIIPRDYRILLIVPPVVVLASMIYWLWRVRARRGSKRIVGAGAPATPVDGILFQS
jgi:hypothetical protein